MATFTLQPMAPFRLDLTASALQRLAINEVDRWDGKTYQRVLVIEESPMAVAVTQVGGRNAPKLRVTAEGVLTRRGKVELTA